MKGRVFILVIVFVTAFSACRNSSKKMMSSDLQVLKQCMKPLYLTMISIWISPSDSLRQLKLPTYLQVRGVPFSQRYLASSLEASNQVSSFDKALAMGILGANLGYLNIYEKTGNSIEVLASIKKLAEGINVGQFFDFETIKRLSLSKSNLDSLLFLSVDSYNKIDKYLTDNNRGQLSALIITGAWIEAQYLVTQVIKQYPDDLLRDRIGEQKQFLNDLIRMMEPYCNLDRQYAGLCSKLKEISDKYDDVEISFTEGEPVSMEQDGGLVITQTETSEIEMTDKQLEDIIKITEQIRNALIVNK